MALYIQEEVPRSGTFGFARGFWAPCFTMICSPLVLETPSGILLPKVHKCYQIGDKGVKEVCCFVILFEENNTCLASLLCEAFQKDLST